MNESTFRYLSSLIHRESGIVLPPEKALLLENRMQKRLRALGIRNEADYLKLIENDDEGDELVELIDVVSTNVTYFYREPRHFEVLGNILRQYKSENRAEVKIWCAAASSGEEPYTLAMECAQNLDLQRQRVRLLATDICTHVLRRALRGTYREVDLEKVPSDRRSAFFERTNDDEFCWRVSRRLSALLLFKKLNLVHFPYPLRGPVDVIFCRNVMIYFDTPTRAKIVREFERLLAKGGFLFLSHSENLLGIEHSLQRYDSAVFRKP